MTVATLKYGEWGSTRLDLELISDFRGANMHQTLASAVRPLTAFPRFMPFPISAFTSGPFPLPFPLSFPLSFPVHFRFHFRFHSNFVRGSLYMQKICPVTPSSNAPHQHGGWLWHGRKAKYCSRCGCAWDHSPWQNGWTYTAGANSWVGDGSDAWPSGG